MLSGTKEPVRAGRRNWRARLARQERLPPFKLALQGGGAHGAFTWGVLDRLLEEPDFRFDAVSGTSAGAMNAVALASGWLAGGADGARRALADLWQATADLARLTPSRHAGLPQMAIDLTAQLLSPYQLNPLGVNPLRDILERQIDFDALVSTACPQVVVAATAVDTGEPVLFSGADLTVEAVLASACLPQLYQAIEIDGRAFWDGGYTCNPPLVPLASLPGASDLLLIQINPLAHPGTPRTAADIRNRLGEIVFGRPLGHDLGLLGRYAGRGWLARLLDPRPERRRLSRHTLHRIDGSVELGDLDPATKMLADAANLNDLRRRGRAAAETWLAARRATRPLAEVPLPDGAAASADAAA